MRVDARAEMRGPEIGAAGDLRPGVPGAAPGTGKDRVSVSAAARALARLRAGIGPVDEVREERVLPLRAGAADGRYRADAAHVARSLLVDVLGHLLS